mmetsp:Transcript_21619/g.46603  ORF Transcript_21619/g.46603 Transcript_21619/m.46603 type:complete len:221 (-) Transcript_21619:245-907(-)
MLCSTLVTSSNSSSRSIALKLASASSSEHSTSVSGTCTSDPEHGMSCSCSAACRAPSSAASVKTTHATSSLSPRPSLSASASSTSPSQPASMAKSRSSSSSMALFSVNLPFRWKLNATEPLDALLQPVLLTIMLTSAVARLLLSESALMMSPTPPKPYASYVNSLKSAAPAGSIAFLMLRSTTSFGTSSALASFITDASARLVSGSSPPALTAMQTFLPI